MSPPEKNDKPLNPQEIQRLFVFWLMQGIKRVGRRVSEAGTLIAPPAHHSRNRIPVLRTADIPLPGDLKKLFAKLVEGPEYRTLVRARARLQIPDHRVINQEGDFARIIISPETHTMPRGIVTTAGIGEFKRHDQAFTLATE